jgi:tRNA pseudouridine13 synthase
MLDEKKFYKLRSKPEDFIVEELLSLPENRKGRFALYLLEKRNLDTREALKIISKVAGVPYREISYAGLKDKHALTRQHITVPRKYRLSLKEPNLGLSFLYYTHRRLRLGAHLGNRFTITLRKMSTATLERLKLNVGYNFPVPNYYDSQRFGSLKGSGEFLAARIIAGDHEGALKLLLTSYYRKEKSYVKRIKKFLKEHWREWRACREFLEKERRYEGFLEAVRYLEDNPGSYRAALRLVDSHLLKLAFSAFQSYLWNEALKAVLREHLGEKRLYGVKYAAGELLFIKKGEYEPYQSFFREYGDKELELPHHKNTNREKSVYEDILSRLGIKLRELKRLNRLVSLTRGKRRMFFTAEKLRMTSWRDGETMAARLSFELPPGCYATVLLKNLLE